MKLRSEEEINNKAGELLQRISEAKREIETTDVLIRKLTLMGRVDTLEDQFRALSWALGTAGLEI